MTLLEFTIHAFETDVSRLKNIVESCGVRIVDWIIQYDASQQENALDLRRSSVVIHCTAKSQFGNYLNAYSQLQSNWFQVTDKLGTLSNRPQLLTLNNRAFVRNFVPVHENIQTSRFCLGTLAWPSEFFSHFEKEARLNFFHDVKSLDIRLQTPLFMTNVPLLRLYYSNIREIYVSFKLNVTDIYLLLVNPPLLYEVETRRIRRGTVILEYETRILEIPNVLSASIIGKSNALKISDIRKTYAEEIVSRLYYRCGKIPVYHVAMVTSLLGSVQYLPSYERLLNDFQCSYLLEAVMRRNFVLQIQNKDTWNVFFSLLQSYSAKNSEIFQKALIKLLHVMDDGMIVNYRTHFETLFNWLLDANHSEQNKEDAYTTPAKTKLVARAVITPTRFILWPPEFMPENRILRNFDSNFALRVSFREDNFNKLSLQASYCKDEVLNAVFNPMLIGIDIGSRHFEFLAWSNSQIRDHGVWMYARDTKQNTASTIRNWMGDFSKIRNVSKYMARMGQCFSQTKNSVKIPLERTRTEPDIVGGISPNGQPFCFSDGIGTLSKTCSQEVRKALGFKGTCSAFQIRFLGYKGMLAIDPNLTDVDAVFRNSMLKFPCNGESMLEIVKITSPIPIYLNRQLITILDYHKVPTEKFLKLQEEMLRTLTDMLLDEEQASSYLQSQSILKVVDFHNLSKSGIALTTEVFFRNMLLALHRRDVDGIKSKARLAIDPSLGRNMFGVLDETATLQYGRVFVQYTREIGKNRGPETEILRGRVLVTKNPCMQPGDVRMLKAVDCPKLHHIKDCIVFPQRGPRPHPNEMAGSDLDGDEYTVIWHKDLFFGQNAQADNFPSPTEEQKPDPIGLLDMVTFLRKYIQNDQLGLICNSHLAFANDKKFGLNSQLCIELAKKARIAVDFAKTGVVVKPAKEEKPAEYPDFMEKGGIANFFRSKGTLGVLYRVSRDFVQSSQYASIFNSDVHCDKDLQYPGWEKYKVSATRSLACYNRLLEEILSTYGVVNESEAMTKAFSRLHSRLQERRDRAEVEEMITSSIQALWKNMKKEFWEEFNAPQEPMLEISSDEEDANDCFSEDVMKKASAWYVATYSQKNPKFLSFPWIVARQLASMKVLKLTKRNAWPPPTRPQIKKFNELVASYSFPQLTSAARSLILEVDNPKITSETLILGACIVKHWEQKNYSTYRRKQTHPDEDLVSLFLHAVAQKNYSSRPSAGELFIDFLRHYLSLRFLNNRQAITIAPFTISFSKQFGKACMFSYHRIAVDGDLSSMNIWKESVSQEMEEIEMEAQLIPRDSLVSTNVDTVKAILRGESGVSSVNIRQKRRSVDYLVTAHGSKDAVRNLQEILQKETYPWLNKRL